MASDSSKTEQLKTQAHELIKSFTVYDAAQRPIEIYTAAVAQVEGGPCSKVEYSYLTLTSFQVEKMKESNAIWQSIWDL